MKSIKEVCIAGQNAARLKKAILANQQSASNFEYVGELLPSPILHGRKISSSFRCLHPAIPTSGVIAFQTFKNIIDLIGP
jgi:hypothetical protein